MHFLMTYIQDKSGGCDMEIFVYFGVGLDVPRDEIEEAIDEVLASRGEVTGGGSGNSGTNIDIEIFDNNDIAAVQDVKNALRNLDLPSDTTIVIDSVRSNLYE